MRQVTSPPSLVEAAAALTIGAIIIAGLYFGSDILVPLALAAVLSFILSPLVRRLERIGMGRAPAVIIVIALVVALLVAGTAGLGTQLAQLAEQLPNYESNLSGKIQSLNDSVGSHGVLRALSQMFQHLEQAASAGPAVSGAQGQAPMRIEMAQNDHPMTTILSYARSSMPTLETAILVLLFTIFVLLQSRDIRDRVLRLMGAREIGRSAQALNDASSDLGHYFLLQAALNSGFGLFVGVALWAIGVPSPGVWGVLAGIMRFIPYVGSILSAVPPLAIAAAVDPGWTLLAETAAIFLAGEPLVGQVIEPLLYGKQTNLSPLAVLVAAAFWVQLWGPIGLILAMPLTLSLVVMGEHIPRLEFLRVLLGNEPALLPHQQLYQLLLAGDAARAARDMETCVEEKSLPAYFDTIAFPALQLGSADERRGVLRNEQLPIFQATLKEFVEWGSETISEQKDVDKISRSAMRVSVIPGRGMFDMAAAELIAQGLRTQTGADAQNTSMAGLTAIGALTSNTRDASPDVIVLVTVGGVTDAQFDLLIRRARKAFGSDIPTIAYLSPESELARATRPENIDDGVMQTVRGVFDAVAIQRNVHDLGIASPKIPLTTGLIA